jgi:hypothetical protein
MIKNSELSAGFLYFAEWEALISLRCEEINRQILLLIINKLIIIIIIVIIITIEEDVKFELSLLFVTLN